LVIDEKDGRGERSLVEGNETEDSPSDEDRGDAKRRPRRSGKNAAADESGGEKSDQSHDGAAEPHADPAEDEPAEAFSEDEVELVIEHEQGFPQDDAQPVVEIPADSKKPAWKGKDRRSPSQKEVLARLLEKNEVILQLTKKNVELESKVKELENKRLRVTAEFENYRKRTRKEWELLKDQTKAEVLGEVLNVVDDFDRAFAASESESEDFMQGIRLIYNNLISILEGFGIRKMDSLGKPFDPNVHMAVATIESKSAKSNHVVEVIQEGYTLDETVVRAAKVVIAK
jgi:molecular chaperone GrpE